MRAKATMPGLTLDAGALIALDRGDRRVALLVDEAIRERRGVAVPAGALGQAWRDGAKQVRLARLLLTTELEVVPLDGRTARASGQLLARRGTSDLVDASVVVCATARGHAVVTSDPIDILELDPTLPVLPC